MGLFDTLDDNVTISKTNPDKPGRYLQRIDAIEVAQKRDGSEYVKISKTTLKVLDDPEGMAQAVGEETTEGLFKNFSFLERDLRKRVMVGFGMSQAEANAIPFKKVKEMLVDKGQLNGEEIEVNVTPGGIGKSGKPWCNVYWEKNHSLEKTASKKKAKR